MVSTPIKSLADTVEEDIFYPDGKAAYDKQFKALAARQTFTISYLVTSRGVHTMVNDHRHPRMKVIQAWVEVKDNSERPQCIELIGLTKPLDIAESYKAGVAISMTMLQRTTELHFIQPVKLKADGDRYVTVTLLCESMEEQP